MTPMTKEEVEAYVRGFLARTRLDVVSVTVEADEPPMDFYAIVDVVVRKGGLGEKGVYREMEDVADRMSHDRGREIRPGYYEMDPEMEDYDPDLAMLEFDQFDFSLQPSAPSP